MRKLVLSLLLAGVVPASAAAQGMWQTEFGIRGGFASVDFTDFDVTMTTLDLPGVGGAGGFGAPFAADAPLYAVLPWKERMAIVPTFGFSSVSAGAVSTTIVAGVRLNYALSEDFYIGAGPTAYIIKLSGQEDTQGAIEAAFGYRRALGSSLRLHAEVFYQGREESEALAQANVLGLRIGAGTALGGGTAGSGRRASAGMWTPAVVLQGGWSLLSAPDAGDLTILALPFTGTAGSFPGQLPSAVSLILPRGERMAIEPSFDLHVVDLEGNDAVTAMSVGARLNYAFNRTAYAGAGLNFTGVETDGIADGASLAWLIAGGLRFPIVGGLSGRTEVNYRVFDGSDVLPAGQTTSFVFGLVVPIN